MVQWVNLKQRYGVALIIANSCGKVNIFVIIYCVSMSYGDHLEFDTVFTSLKSSYLSLQILHFSACRSISPWAPWSYLKN